MLRPIRDYDWTLVQEAIVKWKKLDTRSSIARNQLYEFADFLGCAGANPDKIVNTDDPEIRRLIDMINGPHSVAILKLLELKYEERKTNVQNEESPSKA